jgi:hypothetical protein
MHIIISFFHWFQLWLYSAYYVHFFVGILCDSCGATNFEGLRYRCKICINYDLCGACYNDGKESLQHSKSHSMKCIPEPTCLRVSSDNAIWLNTVRAKRLLRQSYNTSTQIRTSKLEFKWYYDSLNVVGFLIIFKSVIYCILELCATIFERRSVSADGITVYSASSHHQSYRCWEK